MIQTIVDYGGLTVATVLTLVRLQPVIKNRKDTRAIKTWLLTLFISLFVVFQIDIIYIGVDHLLSVDNLSWLLSYIFMTVGTYYMCFIFCERMPRWSVPYGIITIVGLVLVFPFGPGSAVETVDHVTPSNLWEIVFMGIIYLYFVIMVGGIPIPICVRALREGRQTPLDRTRTYIILPALTITVTNTITKFTIYSAGFLFSSMPPSLLHIVTDVSRLQAAALVILWPASLAPNRLYRELARLIGYFQKLRESRDLGWLNRRLDLICRPVLADQLNWLDQIRNPTHCTIRRTISIVDRRKMLAAWLQQPGRVVPGGLSVRQAAQLLQVLQNIPLSASIDDMTSVCLEYDKKLRRNKL